jgi:hypothetical protein
LRRLIEAESGGLAVNFAWATLRKSLWRQWRSLLAILALLVMFRGFAPRLYVLFECAAMALLFLPAVAEAARTAITDASMKRVWCTALCAYALIATPISVLGFEFTAPTHNVIKVAVIIALLLLVWIHTKLSTGPAIYVLSQGDTSIFKAFAESWTLIKGERWWSLFSASLIINVPTRIVQLVAARFIITHLNHTSFASPAYALLFVAVTATMQFLYQAAVVAFLSASPAFGAPPQALETTAPSPA